MWRQCLIDLLGGTWQRLYRFHRFLKSALTPRTPGFNARLDPGIAPPRLLASGQDVTQPRSNRVGLRDLAASYRLANLKALELGVIQIQRLVIPCPTMRSTERL
jgi:hypothetical protein